MHWENQLYPALLQRAAPRAGGPPAAVAADQAAALRQRCDGHHCMHTWSHLDDHDCTEDVSDVLHPTTFTAWSAVLHSPEATLETESRHHADVVTNNGYWRQGVS